MTHTLYFMNQTYAEAIAAHMPDWQSTIDEHNPQDYTPRDNGHARYVMLAYVGSDPDLQGAYLQGHLDTRKNTVAWRCNMHARHEDGGSRYLVNTLPYAQRETWISTVNIALSKSPERVARELTTRLLYHYLPGYRHAMQVLRAEARQKEEDEALARELAEILGCKVERRCTGSRHNPPALYSGKLWGASVEHGALQVHSGFSLNPTQAKQFCRLIAEWQKEDGK